MTDKEKAKLEKRLKKEKIAKEKLEKRLAKAAAKRNPSGKVSVTKTTSADWTKAQQPVEQKETRLSKFMEKHRFKKNLYDRKDIKRDKEAKEKTDYKLAFKEFPVKMVKEVSKIKWAGKKDLTSKFIQVVIFMFVSAAFFYFIDWIFKLIFTAIHVMAA